MVPFNSITILKNSQMDVIDHQRLTTHILKTLSNWEVEDVAQWLSLNGILVNRDILLEDGIDGNKLKGLNPGYWINKMELSRFTAKRIQQWVEEESEEFDHCVKVKLGIIQHQPSSDSQLSLSDLEDEGEEKVLPSKTDTHQQKQNKDKQNQENIAVAKWSKKQKKFFIDEPSSFNPLEKDNPHVKFINTEYIRISENSNMPSVLYDKKLIARVQSIEKIITTNARIGRFKTNDICLSEESVSRNHAQIIKMNKKSETDPIKYYLKDNKSRFGTYVEIFGPYQVQENQTYQVGGCPLTFVNLRVNGGFSQKRATFNSKIKFQTHKETFYKFQNRYEITIGKKNHDVKLNSEKMENYHGRVYVEQKKDCLPFVYIEPIDGKIYRRLEGEELWPIESRRDVNERVRAYFGALEVQFEGRGYCLSCGDLQECRCIRMD